jgi:hypothetical protein
MFPAVFDPAGFAPSPTRQPVPHTRRVALLQGSASSCAGSGERLAEMEPVVTLNAHIGMSTNHEKHIYKVLGQRFSSNTHFTAKMAKNSRFQRVDSQQLLVRFSCTFSKLSRITSNRSYLTCNPPSCGFVEMCCCDHEARFGTGNFVRRPIQKVTWQPTPTTSSAITHDVM